MTPKTKPVSATTETGWGKGEELGTARGLAPRLYHGANDYASDEWLALSLAMLTIVVVWLLALTGWL